MLALPESRLARRRLAEAGRLLASSLDLPELLDRFAGITRELLRADLVSIWLVREADLVLTLGAQAGASRADAAVPLRPERDHGLAGSLLSTGESVAIEDLAADPRVRNRAWFAAEGIRSFLGVPLVVEGTAVGVMASMTRTPRGWSTDDVERAEALGTLAGIAIRNARLHAETGQRLRETETLLAVGRAVTSTLDFTETMRLVARETGRALGADMVGAYLADSDRECLRPVAGYHVPPELLERFMKIPIRLRTNAYIEEGWRSQQAAWCADAQADPRSDPELTRWIPMRSVLFFPLTVKDEPIGGLFLIWWAPRAALTPFELSLLEGIARQTALAIGNARLFEALQRRLRETEALLAMADAFGKTLDVGEIMRRVCREATRALGADSGVFYTLDAEGELVLPAAGYRIPKAVLEHARPLKRAEIPSVLLEAFRARQITFVPDVAADARFRMPAFNDVTVRSMLASPIYSGERAFGTLILYWWDAVREIDPDLLTLMAALSAQAALVLENERLLAEAQSHAAALREKNAELDGFVHTVSHDLKAPLVTIQGMAGALLEEHAEGLDPAARHYLTRIEKNTQQMERLLLDLLALSRVGREARPPEALHLAELVDDILAELAEPLRARGTKVVVGDLPTVRAVRVQMEQVFRNLLTNAVKYMGDTASPTIEIGSASRGADLECWVRDSGIGIDASYHEKVFEIFQRLKEVEAEGSGVGLAIVKKIVEGAGGRIWVESAAGEGSTFRFTWPAPPPLASSRSSPS